MRVRAIGVIKARGGGGRRRIFNLPTPPHRTHRICALLTHRFVGTRCAVMASTIYDQIPMAMETRSPAARRRAMRGHAIGLLLLVDSAAAARAPLGLRSAPTPSAARTAPTPSAALRRRTAPMRMQAPQVDERSTEATRVEDDVVCARGVCVLPDESVAPEVCTMDDAGAVSCTPNESAPQPGLSFAYLWPRGLLLFSSVLYGTNFPLGRLMSDALPASAATSARMLFAALALVCHALSTRRPLRLHTHLAVR